MTVVELTPEEQLRSIQYTIGLLRDDAFWEKNADLSTGDSALDKEHRYLAAAQLAELELQEE